jgi:hypothetical protein
LKNEDTELADISGVRDTKDVGAACTSVVVLVLTETEVKNSEDCAKAGGIVNRERRNGRKRVVRIMKDPMTQYMKCEMRIKCDSDSETRETPTADHTSQWYNAEMPREDGMIVNKVNG